LGSSRCCPVWGDAAVIACASRCALALLRHLIHMALLRQPAKQASCMHVLRCVAASASSSSLACRAHWT
jgi:hypothetical protein